MMNNKKRIQTKFTRLILLLCIGALLLASIASGYTMLKMRAEALKTASDDIKAQLVDLANSKAEIADSMLQLAQNHTLLIADGIKEVLSNKEKYLKGFDENATDLPNLTCSEGYTLGEYSVHIRVPENLLKNIETNDSGVITNAELDYSATTGGELTIKQELYLASLLSNEFAQIERFKDKDGNYKGFAASYFCYDDSGIDVLGDPLATAMISYDGRTRGWYLGAVDAYNKNTLTDSGVYWTEPVQDGSGRGISMICAVPVVVEGKIVGVAGSGGLLVNFAELVESSKIGSTGYSFMVSRTTGKVIINPNITATSSTQSEVMIETVLSNSNNSQLRDIGSRILNGDSGLLDNISIDNEKCYVAFSPLTNNEWTMVTVVCQDDDLIMNGYNELNNQLNTAFIVLGILIALLIIVTIVISSKFAKTLTNPIIQLKDGVNTIGGGNLDYKLSIKTGDEIEELGNAFNLMASNLVGYINEVKSVTAEKERIGAELDVAKNIQASMLPCIFPAFPDKKELDIYATMTPAKEVGGDFYDFFMIDEKHIAIVMADVSGKGVPAALFMVIGKTLIKDHTQLNKSLSDVFTEVNNLLCEANSEGLFITAFEGVLDLETGEFNFVNAGHEMPFIYHKDTDKYEAQKIKPGFVLAGMEGMKFKGGSINLNVGDKIFQYTDGVTEATNKDTQLYGMERLLKVLNTCKNDSPKDTLIKVREDIDKFVGEAPQFDDITMLCLEYKQKMNK